MTDIDVVFLDEELAIDISEEDAPDLIIEIPGSQGLPGPAGADGSSDLDSSQVEAIIEEWAAILDNTLGVLDPDTAIAAVTEVFVGFGVPQEFIDAMVPELEEVFQILLTEQPSDIHAAISNASQLIRLAIARTSILTFQLSLVDGQFGGVNDHLSTIDGQISDIESTLGNYGDIVTHNVAEFATAAQGDKADTALQPGDSASPNELDVTDFGAVLDGVTDDIEAFEAALSAASAEGKDIYMPQGTALVSRKIVLPNGVGISGAGMNRSIIIRPGTLSTSLTQKIFAGDDFAHVEDSSIFTVGGPFHLYDNVNWEGGPAVVYVTNINTDDPDDHIVSFSPPAWGEFEPGIGGTASTLFALIGNYSPADGTGWMGTDGGFVRDLTLDQAVNENDPKNSEGGGLVQTDFVRSTLHIESAKNFRTERVKFLNACGDAYSDQGRADVVGINSNLIENCYIDSPYRHGIHLGTTCDGAKVSGNVVTGVGLNEVSDSSNGYCVFFCSAVTHAQIRGNYFTNSKIGIAGIDERDNWNMVIKNFFINCPAIRTAGTSTDPYGLLIEGNTLYNDSDCPVPNPEMGFGLNGVQVMGNRFHNAILTVSGDSCKISDNTFTHDFDNSPIGFEVTVTISGDDCTFSDNSIDGAVTAVSVQEAHHLQSRGNTIINSIINDLAFSYFESQDVTVDGNYPISYVSDGAFIGSTTRLLHNGFGDNGTDDPAVAGDWNAISGTKWNGTLVKWTDGGALTISTFVQGIGWTELGSATKSAVEALATTIDGYGDIVTHDASEFDPAGSATAAQAAAIQRANHTGTQAQSTVTNLVTDLAAKVPTSRTLAGIDLSADISAGTLRTALALVIGTNVQAFSATLDLIAGLTPAANKIPYFTGSGAASLLNRDTDVTLAADSDTSIATQKAVKSHVNTRTPIHRGATSLTGVKLSTKSGLAGAAVVAGMAGSGRITYTPIFLPAGTYGTLSVVTTVAQASTWRLGVFNHATGDPTKPGTVAVNAGTVNTASTAGALTLSMTLVVADDDWYWCAAQTDAYTVNPTISMMSGGSGVDLLPFYGWPGQMASYLRGFAGYQDWSVSTGSLATARSITNNTSTGLAYAQDVPRFWIGA